MLMTMFKRTLAFALVGLAVWAGIATRDISVGAAVLVAGVAGVLYVGYRYKF